MKIKNFAKFILGTISPKLQVSLQYRKAFGRFPNWKAPQDLNEKINWLKFYSDTSLWTLCADKYRVREYVESKGCGESLVKLYGMWEDAEKIDWDSLPPQFVMKVNNGSGDILVCRDKTTLDYSKYTNIFNTLLHKKFGDYNGEPHYAAMKPCIIAEELLDCTKQPIVADTLIDYKIWCFNGKPYFVWACYNRHKEDVEVGCYDLDWNYHPEWSVFTHHYKESSQILPKPVSLLKMLDIASKLSEGIPQVRVDLYEVDGKPYFGEMTFTSAGGYNGFYTKGFLKEMGSCIKLPKKK